jgi:transposase
VAWAGLARGSRESAGKRKHDATRKGKKHLKAAMVEAAWGAARTRSRIGARLPCLVRRFGQVAGREDRGRRHLHPARIG